MDAAQALADLTEISSQIETAVLFDESGSVLASTLADETRATELARAAAELLDAAAEVQPGGGTLTQLDAATLDGSVFVVRDGERRRTPRGPARARLPRGRLPAPLGEALQVLPRQISLRDATGPPGGARRPDRGDRPRARAPGDEARRAGARRRRPRGRGLA